MKKISYLLACIALTGCASAFKTTVVSSSPRTVVIQSFDGIADAQKTANIECKKHDRFARLATTIDGAVEFIFDCVQ